MRVRRAVLLVLFLLFCLGYCPLYRSNYYGYQYVKEDHFLGQTGIYFLCMWGRYHSGTKITDCGSPYTMFLGFDCTPGDFSINRIEISDIQLRLEDSDEIYWHAPRCYKTTSKDNKRHRKAELARSFDLSFAGIDLPYVPLTVVATYRFYTSEGQFEETFEFYVEPEFRYHDGHLFFDCIVNYT